MWKFLSTLGQLHKDFWSGDMFSGPADNIANGSYLWSTKQQMDYQNELNRQNWAQENEYNSPAAQMARYRAAGLNPDLIYGQNNQAGSMGSVDIPQSSPAARTLDGVANLLQKGMNVESMQSQIDLNKSLARKADAEAGQADATAQYTQSITIPKELRVGLAEEELRKKQGEANLYFARVDTEQVQQLLFGSQTRMNDLLAVQQQIKNQFAEANETLNLQIKFEQLGATRELARKTAAEATYLIESLPLRLSNLRASTEMLRAKAAESKASASLMGRQEEFYNAREAMLKKQGESIDSQIWYREQLGQTLYGEIFEDLKYKNLLTLDSNTGQYQYSGSNAVALDVVNTILDYGTQYLGRIAHFGIGSYTHTNKTNEGKVHETVTTKSGNRSTTVSRHRSAKE